jgi:hypothetical protein
VQFLFLHPQPNALQRFFEFTFADGPVSVHVQIIEGRPQINAPYLHNPIEKEKKSVSNGPALYSI